MKIRLIGLVMTGFSNRAKFTAKRDFDTLKWNTEI